MADLVFVLIDRGDRTVFRVAEVSQDHGGWQTFRHEPVDVQPGDLVRMVFPGWKYRGPSGRVTVPGSLTGVAGWMEARGDGA